LLSVRFLLQTSILVLVHQFAILFHASFNSIHLRCNSIGTCLRFSHGAKERGLLITAKQIKRQKSW
jgi:hypothetical protein